jgi:hypothetical protein
MSTRQAKWVLVGGALGLFGLAGCVAYLGRPYPPGPEGRWANLGRIEVCMSRQEAESAIGCRPQGDWVGDPTESGPPGTRVSLLWSGAECDIWVHLDDHGRVIGRQGIGPPPPSGFGRLRARLGL